MLIAGKQQLTKLSQNLYFSEERWPSKVLLGGEEYFKQREYSEHTKKEG